MNKHCFQVIFSKSQQQFVVVSELAKSSGKSSAMPKAKVDDLFSLLFENLVSKENSQSETWQNNQLQAGKLVTNSANGKLTLDATNVKAERWEGEVQAFEAISRQDITKYSSEQVQAGGSVSVTYGSGGGANFNAAYNSAKLNTAQVENQTSVDIGKGGMNVTVQGNTHLDGAIITSEAEQENNRFQIGTLTTSDIQNHSELKTKSAAISGGTSGVNPMSALSLLGNKNESEQSTTRAAVGENINIVLTNDENAEQTLNKLNRDTQNANQKVTKHDIHQVQETQELIKGIGEISDKAFQIYTHSEREAIEKAKLELGKVETRLKNEGKTKEEIAQHPEYKALKQDLNDKQQTFDNAYGTGSKTKRAVDAVTAALQGLAAKDAGQAVVGLASPYLNEQIKLHTLNTDGSVNTEANLIAHALLGAVEAAATGNNLLAGAVAGAGSEAAADFIVQTLYDGKSTKELSESEKQTVTFLSQLAGGLASGIIGDSTQSAAVGADIGKRAVENNYLSQLSQNRRDWLREQLKRQDLSAKKREQYEQEYRDLERDDHTSDYLVAKALHNPEKMTKSDWALYIDYARRYYLESAVSHNRPEDIKANLNNILSNNYIRGYDYPYALAEQYRANLPSRWSLLGINKSEDEKFYSDIAKKYENRATYENSFNGRVAKSTAEALGYAGSLVMPTSTVLSSIPKIGELAKKYPTLSEMAIIGTANTVAQLSSKDPYLYSSLVEAELSYLLTRKDSASVAWSKNMVLGTYMVQAEKQEKETRFGIKEDPEYFKKIATVTGGSLIGKLLDTGYGKIENSPLMNKYGESIIRPTLNSISGEISTKIISEKIENIDSRRRGGNEMD